MTGMNIFTTDPSSSAPLNVSISDLGGHTSFFRVSRISRVTNIKTYISQYVGFPVEHQVIAHENSPTPLDDEALVASLPQTQEGIIELSLIIEIPVITMNH